jgi:hypothetical protein
MCFAVGFNWWERCEAKWVCFGEPNAAKAWLKPWLNRPPDPSAASSDDRSYVVCSVGYLVDRGADTEAGSDHKRHIRDTKRQMGVSETFLCFLCSLCALCGLMVWF